MEETLFGQILLDFQLITESDLERCLQLQRKLSPRRRLGEILVQERLLDERTLGSILSVQRQKLDTGRNRAAAGPSLADQLAGAGAAEYLRAARKLGASDLYLSSGRVPTARLHGHLVELPAPALTFESGREMLFALLSPEQIAKYEEQKSVDLTTTVEEVGRCRVNVFRHFRGIGAVFRILPDALAQFTALGLPDAVQRFVDLKGGLVLITGATGSGKSTTLASLIELINENHKVHVITLEDPIEHVFASKRALVTQRELSTHTHSYADALRAALREDPDVIVVGEMRDPETTATALTAAETGHLVFGTLHTRTAHSTIVRIIDQFPADKRAHVRTMLAGVLRGVVCQELVPDIDGKGRSLAAEVMIVNAAISNLIRENRVWQIPMVMQMNANAGMRMMDDSLRRLVQEGKITVEEALARVTDESRLAEPQTT